MLDRVHHQDVGQQQRGFLHFLSGDHMKQWVGHAINHHCEQMLPQESRFISLMLLHYDYDYY